MRPQPSGARAPGPYSSLCFFPLRGPRPAASSPPCLHPEIGLIIGAAHCQHPQAPVGCHTPVPQPHGACCAESWRSLKHKARPHSPPSRPTIPDSGQDSRAEPGAAARLPSAQDHPTSGNAVRGACSAARCWSLLPLHWPGHVIQTSHQVVTWTMNTLGPSLFTRMPPFPSQMASRNDRSQLQGQNTNCGFRSTASCALESKRLTNPG